MSKNQRKIIEDNEVKVEILGYGITGPNKALLLNSQLFELPFYCPDIKLTDRSVLDFECECEISVSNGLPESL